MRTEVHVRFDRDEREIIGEAHAHLNIAVPDDAESRALSACVCGTDVGHATLTRAERVLTELVECCREQSVGDWWRENVIQQPEGDNWRMAPGTGGLALVADVDTFVSTMAEARAGQARQAMAALTLVREALAAARPAPPEE